MKPEIKVICEYCGAETERIGCFVDSSGEEKIIEFRCPVCFLEQSIDLEEDDDIK